MSTPKSPRPAAKPFAPGVRERAVRLVLEHQAEYTTPLAASRSLAEPIGGSTEALRTWVRRAERDAGSVRD